MTTICYVFFAILISIIFLYVFLELHYFVRSFFCVLCARICKKKIHILHETQLRGLCIFTDIDYLLTHMNNARFIRELDFAKLDFYERTGLYQCIKKHGGAVAMGATTIRYRRFIKLFSRYVLTSKIIYWDSQYIYMEHKFISPYDNFINAVIMCRTRLTNCNAEDVITELLVNSNGGNAESVDKAKPEMSPELEKWIESNELSSAALRSA